MGCGGSSKKEKGQNLESAETAAHAESKSMFPRWSGKAAVDPSYLFSRLRQANLIKEENLDSACVILKQTFDVAMSQLDAVSEHDYFVVTMLLQHARDALTEWTHSMDDTNLYDIPLQEIEMKASEVNVEFVSSGDENSIVVGRFSIVSSTSTEESTSITNIFVDPQFLYSKLRHAQNLKRSQQMQVARKILRSTFENAIQDLDALDEKYFKATTELMQHIRDALTEWDNGNEVYNIPIDIISQDMELGPFVSQNTLEDIYAGDSSLPSLDRTPLKRNGR